MSFLLTLLLVFAATPFESSIERAFAGIQNNEWKAAASALDQAYALDPVTFAANNFHYLRGRVAASEKDWQRARDEFKKVGTGNPLNALATFHAAQVSAKLHENDEAGQFIALLPADFPTPLKMQIA